MKLSEWLNTPNPDGSRKRRDEFAHNIGVTPQMISAYCAETLPGKAIMKEIVRETAGAVTPNDFLDIESVLSELEHSGSAGSAA